MLLVVIGIAVLVTGGSVALVLIDRYLRRRARSRAQYSRWTRMVLLGGVELFMAAFCFFSVATETGARLYVYLSLGVFFLIAGSVVLAKAIREGRAERDPTRSKTGARHGFSPS